MTPPWVIKRKLKSPCTVFEFGHDFPQKKTFLRLICEHLKMSAILSLSILIPSRKSALCFLHSTKLTGMSFIVDYFLLFLAFHWEKELNHYPLFSAPKSHQWLPKHMKDFFMVLSLLGPILLAIVDWSPLLWFPCHFFFGQGIFHISPSFSRFPFSFHICRHCLWLWASALGFFLLFSLNMNYSLFAGVHLHL